MQHIAQEGRCYVVSGKPLPLSCAALGLVSAVALVWLFLALARIGRTADHVANQYHSALDFPADYPPNANAASSASSSKTAAEPEVWSRGGSCIVGPLGQVLAGPLWDEEGILYADVRPAPCCMRQSRCAIFTHATPETRDDAKGRGLTMQLDLDALDGMKLDFDPVGHYARADLMKSLILQ